MDDAEAYVNVNGVRKGIASDRRKAFWYKPAGHVVNFVGLATLVTGLIKGLALAPAEVRNGLIFGGLCRLAVEFWLWMDGIMPPVWWFLRSISPYPRLTSPLTQWSLLLSCGGLFAWSFGLMWLGGGLLQRSKTLSEQASKKEEKLDFLEPFLLHLQPMQSSQKIDISGHGNVVNAVNKINNIRENDEKGWWTKPTGLIVIGVAISIISKILLG